MVVVDRLSFYPIRDDKMVVEGEGGRERKRTTERET